MFYVNLLFDFFLQTEASLRNCITHHALAAYCLLFSIIFLETGIIFCFFLPGDAFLFLLGGIAAQGILSLPILVPLLTAAAILGALLNYHLGKLGGQFLLKHYRGSCGPAWTQAHHFYEKHGGKALIISRFLPFLRTFIPFIAGISVMNPTSFMVQNVIGACLWIGSVVGAGYLCGELPWVKAHLPVLLFLALCSLFIPLLMFFVQKIRSLTPLRKKLH